MPLARGRFPIHPGKRSPRLDDDIVGLNRQRAIQNRIRFGIAAENFVAERYFPKSNDIAWVQLHGAQEIAQSFLVIPATPVNRTRARKDARIIRQGATSKIKLSECWVVIEISGVKMFRPRQVGFSGIGSETECCLESCLCQGEARWCVIDASQMDMIVHKGELALGGKEGGISRHRLVEQIKCSQQILHATPSEASEEIPGPTVEFKGGDILARLLPVFRFS